ncbi:uncharacterized protein [Clytia hemisphaerica]|uniref:Chitin-binding type-2 domain-containing protein n=1 Tax=Clytia hemisphaerica TaxID=252671 RepID=A0A7M5TWX5_9CNID
MALFAVCSASSFYEPYNDCPSSLCKWKPHGATFRLSDKLAPVFVQCSHGNAICLNCPHGTIFNNQHNVCVRDQRGSKKFGHFNKHGHHGDEVHHFNKDTTTMTTTPTATTSTTTEKIEQLPHDIHCPSYLCKWKPNGALFRLRNDKPQYYVQCSNGIAYCRQCPSHQYFNNKFSVCVRRTVAKDW